jgi:hypothetical protein
MGTVPPPPPPAFEEWRRRYDKGARSMEDLDPAFAGYIRKERRFLAIGRVVLWIAEIILGSLAFCALATRLREIEEGRGPSGHAALGPPSRSRDLGGGPGVRHVPAG